jgi:hypothetical protein
VDSKVSREVLYFIVIFDFRPLQLPANSGDELPFFRVDGRLSDVELKKYLTDFNK